MTKVVLKLNGFAFQELFDPAKLVSLDQRFVAYLESADALLQAEFLAYRQEKLSDPKAISELLVAVAPLLEAFIAELFDIEESVGQLQTNTLSHQGIFGFKKYYVLRLAKRSKFEPQSSDFDTLNAWVSKQLEHHHIQEQDRELAIAKLGARFLEDPKENEFNIDQLANWCVAAMKTEIGRKVVNGWVSFKLPQSLNYENLVDVVKVKNDDYGRLEGPANTRRQRDGFTLTDSRMNLRQVLNEVHYCVYCHKNDGDFCSKGFPVKKGQEALGLKINPVGETLTGCPLEEKISEMHTLKGDGYGIAALAVVMIDNPMCPATGHRICNDCMKACIYQKQDPVNIPEVETRILTDVLALPWGVEIYDLLTRWNPLRQKQYVAKPYNGLKVLVMGMGPAGFTMAHHLLMEGFAVVGAEGLKIEPLPKHLLDQPIYDYASLQESLDHRVMAGFGGVAEYGITVRWDKNFLKLIYISLMRRPYFQVFGSIRFGGTLTLEDAWQLGFDHLTLAVGAGLPRELRIPDSMAPGMRQANDFLMALQLTGAAKDSSLANLQVRLPAVVIGGGLTGIDTATEVQAYYIKQVEKMYHRYQTMAKYFGEKTIRSKFDADALAILEELLEHGRLVVHEREQAAKEQRKADFIKLIRDWGGVTIAYRRSMQESPAYKRNHEEVIKAFEEGIYYAEGLEPSAVVLDSQGYVKGLKCRWRIMDEEGNWMLTDEEQQLPARSIFVATGASPNIAYEYEHRGSLQRQANKKDYARFEFQDGQLVAVEESGHVKIKHFGPFTSYHNGTQHHRVSFIGDTHPIFHGSVVKAISSAKQSYPHIVQSLEDRIQKGDKQEYQQFRSQMESLFRAEIVSIKRLNQNVVELKVRAPVCAKHAGPGQFYRLQNYECLAAKVGDTRLQTEALALIGIVRPQEPDIITFMVQEKGVSSRLVATWKVGQHVSVMGPTGARVQAFNSGEIAMIIGGGLAIAHALSIACALRAAQGRLIFVACFDDPTEVYARDELEAIADTILWVSESSKFVKSKRAQDYYFADDVATALRSYALLQNTSIPLNDVNRVMIVGGGSLIRTIGHARNAILKPYFRDDILFMASVYGPMQCMLKGVCAQCLQWQIDPATGRRTKAVYACSWQNQPLEIIDVQNIDERLAQNQVQETLTNLWLDYLMERHSIEGI